MDENDNDVTLNVSLDDSFIDAVTSTPVRCRTAAYTTNAFKVPPPPQAITPNRPTRKPKTQPKRAKKPKPNLVCNLCGKNYVCMGSYKNHMRCHAIQVANERYPDRDKIKANLDQIVNSTLKKVVASPSGGHVNETAQYCLQNIGLCINFHLFAETVCEEFVQNIVTKKFLLPSKLRDALIKQCEFLFSSLPLRSKLISPLYSMSFSVSTETADFFFCEYVLCFSEELLKFIAVSVHQGGVSRKGTFQCDEEDRKIIHYVGGATLRAFIKMSGRYPHSKVWKSVKESILNCMVENERVDAADSADISWTVNKNRGSLLFIGDTCLEFLVLLAEIIEENVEANGSISIMNVYEKVVNSIALTVYWDRMISDSLTEDVSVLFLRALVKSFCQTYGRGMAKRRINKIKERPEASISLRHSLVRVRR